MLTTKKVLEDAIKVRGDELTRKKEIQYIKSQTVGECEFIKADISNTESQIAELKQSLQIIYDANKGTQKH